jgi:hypothetical protein
MLLLAFVHSRRVVAPKLEYTRTHRNASSAVLDQLWPGQSSRMDGAPVERMGFHAAEAAPNGPEGGPRKSIGGSLCEQLSPRPSAEAYVQAARIMLCRTTTYHVPPSLLESLDDVDDQSLE